MMRTVFAVFLMLHGLVHLLYLGQSAGAFELQPGLRWPAGSWAFARPLGDSLTRRVAAILLALAATAFVAGGLGLFLKQSWWQPVAVGAAALSAIIYILMWDGGLQRLDDKGAVGLLLNLVLLFGLLVFHWPRFNF